MFLLRVLPGINFGFSEEARTRGFPLPSMGGFDYIVAAAKYNRTLSDCPIVNRIGTYTGNGNEIKKDYPRLFEQWVEGMRSLIQELRASCEGGGTA